MRVENHLLALARIGPHERHPAWAQPDMGDLDRRRHPVQHDDLVAPVELVGFARRKAQRYIGLRCRGPARRPPNPGVAANRVIAALIAEPAELLEDTNQRQPLARRLLLVRQQQPVELAPPRVNPRQWLPAAVARLPGPIAVWSSFEASVIRDLVALSPDLAELLAAVLAHIADLLPIVRNHLAHPAFRGSYSMKSVAPAVGPDLIYGELD